MNLPTRRARSLSISAVRRSIWRRVSAVARRRSPRDRAAETEPPPGPSWTLDAKFDRVLMAQGRASSDVVAHAENDGRMVRQLRIEGRTGPRAPFLVQIVPDRGGRRLTASADDAGELLRGLDYVRSMQGGKLSVQAQYDDAQPDRPLVGYRGHRGFPHPRCAGTGQAAAGDDAVRPGAR